MQACNNEGMRRLLRKNCAALVGYPACFLVTLVLRVRVRVPEIEGRGRNMHGIRDALTSCAKRALALEASSATSECPQKKKV